MKRPIRPANQGFTLVEMLVALSLFAAIAAMGVAMLRSSVDTQSRVQDHLADLSDFNKLRAVMAHDLGQALPRKTRDVRGNHLPAFIGTAQEFAFVHTGDDGLEARSVPDAERVRYALQDGEWRRARQAWLDGRDFEAGDAMAGDVTGLNLRYRDAAGNWHAAWPVNDREALPRALEMRLSIGGAAPVTMLFLIAPAPRQVGAI
jgi:general secretion pathway protein J